MRRRSWSTQAGCSRPSLCEDLMRRRFVTLDVFTETRFAGNPLAVVLERLDGASAREFALEEKIGLVPCRVEPLTADSGRAQFDLPRLPEPAGRGGKNAAIAAAPTPNPPHTGF